MNSREVERLYFQWVDIYKVCKSKKDKATARGMVVKFSYLLGLI